MHNVHYLLPGFLGLLLQVFVVKIPQAKAKAKVANHPFSLKLWFAEDWSVLAGNLVAVFLLLTFVDALIALKPGLKHLIEMLFAFVGYTGSSLFMAAFSRFDKSVMKTIDEKTNIADEILTTPSRN